jgi:hypothetical protein
VKQGARSIVYPSNCPCSPSANRAIWKVDRDVTAAINIGSIYIRDVQGLKRDPAFDGAKRLAAHSNCLWQLRRVLSNGTTCTEEESKINRISKISQFDDRERPRGLREKHVSIGLN